MRTIAVVPGSFDPVTLGHLDVIVRAARVFDEVHVLVVHNPAKSALIAVDRRVALIEEGLAEMAQSAATELDDVVVTSWGDGLLVDYCTRVGAQVLVKGVRSQVDVGYEMPMALMNRSLAGVETVFMLPDPAHALVSSSLVRQVAGLGGDVRAYVPSAVAAYFDAEAPQA